MLRFERFQSRLGHGPGLAAHESGDIVTVVDLSTDERFTALASARR